MSWGSCEDRRCRVCRCLIPAFCRVFLSGVRASFYEAPLSFLERETAILSVPQATLVVLEQFASSGTLFPPFSTSAVVGWGLCRLWGFEHC